MTRYILPTALVAFWLGCGQPLEHPFSDDAVIVGEVVTGEGTPATNVFVTSWSSDSAYSVSVVTDERGRFAAPLVRPTAYALAAHGPTIKATSLEGSGTDDVVIEVEGDAGSALHPASAYLSLLPDGETKRKFILDCTGCHQFDRQIVEVDGQPRTRESWVERINQMIAFSGGSSQFPVMSPSRNAEETADWLVAHLNATRHPEPSEGSLVAGAPRDDSMGRSARATITEYPIPEQADLPHDLAVDSRGHVIVTGMFTHLLYDLDPATGDFATIPIPVQFANPRAVDIDANGVYWTLLGFPQMIAGFNPADSSWSQFSIGMYPHSIIPNDGAVWFNGHFTKDPELMGRLDVATGEIETFEVPVPPMPDGGTNMPYGLRKGPDGAIWGTELIGNRLIKLSPDDKMFSVYPLPTPFSGPRRPDPAPDGTIWIPEYAANRIAAFDPALEKFTEYELPVRDALPYIVRHHPNTGHIWVATAAADAVFSFNPETAQFTTYNLPSPRSLIRHMAVDRETDGVWVAYGNSPSVTPKVARIVPW
ncbi:MAG TPA: hypothetical protein VMO47_14670 [Rhodothermales bacterium]|nr:hypothetical protein [Rhodothermales bacterium]